MKAKRLLLSSLLLAVTTAHAQVNLFDVLRSAQNIAQQAGVAVPAGSIADKVAGAVSAGKTPQSSDPPYGEYEVQARARLYGNVRFEDYFKCGQASARPLVSSISLRGITLGDVCALPDEALSTRYGTNDYHGQLRGFLIRNAIDALSGASAAQNAAPGESHMSDASGRQWVVGLYTSRTQPPGLARAIVALVSGAVCAADPTNSLQSGNSFRVALEQKYGRPSVEIGPREAIKKHEQELTRVKQQYGGQPEAIQDNIMRNDLSFRNWVGTLPASTIMEVDWVTPDGVKLMVVRSQDGCGSSPAFDMMLMPNREVPIESQFLVHQWAEPIGAFGKSQNEARSATAPTPKF
ncbi:hypothetical protein RA280_38905 [Cupriavidus sp. CV2]|uniref:hypothetical protein n=1 Tax=Cupriavidus ulmosensis TaxID=3065913 RepID=UPI00296AD200|nr:hypothetical protein [Cupriavidus sp. CV2]MDW3687603.1 hypothetical protein [Cupriavidus sp. CV2]